MKTIHEDEGYETAGNNGQLNKLRTALHNGEININTTSANANQEIPTTITSGAAIANEATPNPTTPTAAAAAAATTNQPNQRTIKCVSESGVGKILPGQPTSKKVLSKRKPAVKVAAETRLDFQAYVQLYSDQTSRLHL